MLFIVPPPPPPPSIAARMLSAQRTRSFPQFIVEKKKNVSLRFIKPETTRAKRSWIASAVNYPVAPPAPPLLKKAGVQDI